MVSQTTGRCGDLEGGPCHLERDILKNTRESDLKWAALALLACSFTGARGWGCAPVGRYHPDPQTLASLAETEVFPVSSGNRQTFAPGRGI